MAIQKKNLQLRVCFFPCFGVKVLLQIFKHESPFSPVVRKVCNSLELVSKHIYFYNLINLQCLCNIIVTTFFHQMHCLVDYHWVKASSVTLLMLYFGSPCPNNMFLSLIGWKKPTFVYAIDIFGKESGVNNTPLYKLKPRGFDCGVESPGTSSVKQFAPVCLQHVAMLHKKISDPPLTNTCIWSIFQLENHVGVHGNCVTVERKNTICGLNNKVYKNTFFCGRKLLLTC